MVFSSFQKWWLRSKTRRNMEKRLKNSKARIFKHCRTKMIRKHKNNSPSIWPLCQRAVSDRLQEVGKIQKNGRWVPHEFNDSQLEKRKNTCNILIARYKRKSFLHRTVTGDEKWMYFENLNLKNCW